MAHEESETEYDDKTKKYKNVYGRRQKKAGEQLPGTPQYDTLQEAIEAAEARSRSFDGMEKNPFSDLEWRKAE